MKRTILIDAPREVVWRCFTDPDLRARWLGPGILDPRPGGPFRATLDGGPTLAGDVVEVEPGVRLVFTFGWDPHPGVPDLPAGASRVEVTLTDEAGGTRVTVHHTGLPDDLVGPTVTGWEGYLERLAAVR
jgi:uncharacterized protein YndB with AHSA1/START domain